MQKGLGRCLSPFMLQGEQLAGVAAEDILLFRLCQRESADAIHALLHVLPRAVGTEEYPPAPKICTSSQKRSSASTGSSSGA